MTRSIRVGKSLLASAIIASALTGVGVAQADETLEADISAYPGTSNEISGEVETEFDDGYVTVEYDLSGLEPSATGGLHIHVGTSCENAADVGGHYYAPKAGPDYWSNANWVSDAKGDAKGSFRLLSSLDGDDNEGHAVVVHDSTGARVGCGVLED